MACGWKRCMDMCVEWKNNPANRFVMTVLKRGGRGALEKGVAFNIGDGHTATGILCY